MQANPIRLSGLRIDLLRSISGLCMGCAPGSNDADPMSQNNSGNRDLVARPPSAPQVRGAPSAYQTAAAVVRRDLRAGLFEAAKCAGPCGFGSVVFRAGAALYALLSEHSVDRRGRCCWCRRPAAVVGCPRQRCRIYPLAQHWLHLSRAEVGSGLRQEFGLPIPPSSSTTVDRPGLTISGRVRQDETDPLPEIGGTSTSARLNYLSPVVSPATCCPPGWCQPEKAAGFLSSWRSLGCADGPRFRRAPQGLLPCHS